MCAFATCTQRGAQRSVFGQRVHWAAHRSDLMRLRVLQEHGGMYLDHDAFVLAPLRTLQICRHASVIAGIERLSPSTTKLNNGVLVAEKGAPFLKLWWQSYADYRSEEWDWNSCVQPYNLSRHNPTMVQLLPEIGPLRRFGSRLAYSEHMRQAPLVHLTGLHNARWRQDDVQRFGLLEIVYARVLRAANRTALNAQQMGCVNKLHQSLPLRLAPALHLSRLPARRSSWMRSADSLSGSRSRTVPRAESVAVAGWRQLARLFRRDATWGP